MDIAPRDAPARRSGGIVSSLRRWNPTKTPKTTVTLALYLFGLFVAFVARPPVTITDQMQTRYFEMMDAAESMSLDDRELQEAPAQARAMMEANSRQTA